MITLGTWKFHYSQKNTKRDIVSSQRLTHNWIRFFVSPTHNASIIIIIPFFSLPFFLSSNILFVRVRGFGSPPTWRKIHYFCCTCRTSHTRIWATHSLSFSHMTLHLHIYISTLRHSHFHICPMQFQEAQEIIPCYQYISIESWSYVYSKWFVTIKIQN